MAEHVRLWQNRDFEVKIWAPPPQEPESNDLHHVEKIHELTPYGLLLASFGECTGVVLHTYAQHHDIDLQEVEFELAYDREYDEDCENCEHIEKYEEKIELQLALTGDFSDETRDKLFDIAKQCPIHKMFRDGIETNFAWLEASK